MYLLPSEQKVRAEEAIQEFQESGSLTIYEPCDCGSQIRHSSGGNYHEIIELRQDSGQFFVRYDTTCTLTPPATREACEDPEAVIREYADWL